MEQEVLIRLLREIICSLLKMKGTGENWLLLTALLGSAEGTFVPLGLWYISCFHTIGETSDNVVAFSILKAQVTVDNVQNRVRGRSYIALPD